MINKTETKKRGVLLSEDLYLKIQKIQLELSYNNGKRLSMQKVFEHIINVYNK